MATWEAGSGMNHEGRAIAFARRYHERMATRIVSFKWGSAYLEDDVPLRYGSQFLWVDGASLDADATGLIAEADRILGGEGFGHRIIGLDDVELADRVACGFEAAGWSQDRLTLMVLMDVFDQAGRMIPKAREVTAEEMRPLLEKVVRSRKSKRSEDAIAMLSSYSSNLSAGVGARFFAAGTEPGGELVAACDLYLDGDDAQIESVNTLSEARNAGHGTAVVLAAIETARSAGAKWIHLYADADDWPRYWYEKLGFESVGTYCEFRKFPQ